MKPMLTPVLAAMLTVAACRSGDGASSCGTLAPTAYTLEVPVGETRLPGRLDLLCLNGGRTWGRLLVGLGPDTLTGAVKLSARAADTIAFVSGGAVVGLRLVTGPTDSAGGVILLVGGRSFAFHAHRDPAGPAPVLAEHAVLDPVLPGTVSTDSGESYPVPLAGDRLIFTRHGADLTRQRLMLSLPGDRPRPLLDGGLTVSDRSPSVSPDGRLLLFASNRDPENPRSSVDRTALWFMHAAGDGWSSPQPVSWPRQDRPASPQQPVLTADGTLYFVDDRDDGIGERDVYRARWTDGGVVDIGLVPPPISSPADEAGLYASPDGRTLVIARTRGRGHQGGDDLYVHVWSAGAWSEGVNLGLPVNTFANEYGPWLGADGRLWFSSDRFGSGDLFSVALGPGAGGTLTPLENPTRER